jgi:hypothetical protein
MNGNKSYDSLARAISLNMPFQLESLMENVLLASYVMIKPWELWLSALSVRRKLASLRKLGRWLEEKTRAARELNSQLDSSSAVENRSDLF